MPEANAKIEDVGSFEKFMGRWNMGTRNWTPTKRCKDLAKEELVLCKSSHMRWPSSCCL
jgi:hypothetical protein